MYQPLGPQWISGAHSKGATLADKLIVHMDEIYTGGPGDRSIMRLSGAVLAALPVILAGDRAPAVAICPPLAPGACGRANQWVVLYRDPMPGDDAKIGHSALTWNVLADPPRLEETIRDCAEIGFTGTETGGFVYDWWERERPGDLKRSLPDQVGDGMSLRVRRLDRSRRRSRFEGEWTALGPGSRSWAASMLMLVPGDRRTEPPYGLDDFRRMAET